MTHQEDCEHAAWCQKLEAWLYVCDIVTGVFTKTHRNAQGEVVEYQEYTRYDAIDERDIVRKRATPRNDL